MNTNLNHGKISAIVCAYNEERTIRDVMETLISCPRIYEVIVVDDGSYDQTNQILINYQNKENVRVIVLPENHGKGYGMAIAASYAKGDLLLFIDADLINLSNQHISIMVDAFFAEEADMVLGFPIRGKSIAFTERLDPFQHLTGQRILYRNDFLHLQESIYSSGYGVETILNSYYQEEGKHVCSIFLPNLNHPIKFEKAGLGKAIAEYLLEGKEILAIKIKKTQSNWQSKFLCNEPKEVLKLRFIKMNKSIKILRSVISKPTIIFSEQIPLNEPVVFVANHEKNYGPMMMHLFFPILYRPWVIYNMLDEEDCQLYIQETFFKERLGWPNWLSRPVSNALASPLVRLMHSTNPVPVFRGKPEQIVETFNKSINSLEEGENLLIFPEKPDAENYSEEVKKFFDGFIYLAKLYHRKTNKRLLFCPVSINPFADTISVGKAIRYNPDIEFHEETEKINKHLMEQVSGLYHQPWLSKRQFTPEKIYQTIQNMKPKTI